MCRGRRAAARLGRYRRLDAPRCHLTVSTSPIFDEALEAFLDGYRSDAVPPDVFVRLSAEEVATRCRSPRFRAGAFNASGRTVQPARVVRGLRKLILEKGVRVFEATPVRRSNRGGPYGCGRPEVL